MLTKNPVIPELFIWGHKKNEEFETIIETGFNNLF